jgi:hypothetical protein
MCTLLGGTELPDRLEVIDAIVEGCGGTERHCPRAILRPKSSARA